MSQSDDVESRGRDREPVHRFLGEFLSGRKTTFTYPRDALNLMRQPVAFSDDYRGLEGRCCLRAIGVGQEYLAAGDGQDGLPLRCYRVYRPQVPVKLQDSLS